jgi:hypothetical protein
MRRHGSLKFFKSAASMEVMPVAAIEYVGFRSPYPSSSGLKIGVFGLVNVLGRRGMLTARRADQAWSSRRPAGLRPGELPQRAGFSPHTRREIIRGAARTCQGRSYVESLRADP